MVMLAKNHTNIWDYLRGWTRNTHFWNYFFRISVTLEPPKELWGRHVTIPQRSFNHLVQGSDKALWVDGNGVNFSWNIAQTSIHIFPISKNNTPWIMRPVAWFISSIQVLRSLQPFNKGPSSRSSKAVMSLPSKSWETTEHHWCPLDIHHAVDGLSLNCLGLSLEQERRPPSACRCCSVLISRWALECKCWENHSVFRGPVGHFHMSKHQANPTRIFISGSNMWIFNLIIFT